MVSTIGVTVHKHYCENELVATSILPHGDEDACDTNMPMPDNSCTDEHEQFNVDSPIVILAFNFDSAQAFDYVASSFYVFIVSEYENLFTPKYYADMYPPPSEPNIYKKVQSFLL